MDPMSIAVAVLVVVIMSAIGWTIDRSRRLPATQRIKALGDGEKDIVWLARAMGPPVDWQQFEERIALELEDDPWAEITDKKKEATWRMCMNWSGWERHEDAPIPVAEMVGGIPSVENTHAATCPRCGKPMYGASGSICGVCVMIEEERRFALPWAREVLARHAVPPHVIEELDDDRILNIAEHLTKATNPHIPAWYDSGDIELIRVDQTGEPGRALNVSGHDLITPSGRIVPPGCMIPTGGLPRMWD